MINLKFEYKHSFVRNYEKVAECLIEVPVPSFDSAHITYRDVPELVEVVNWCIETFGDDLTSDKWAKSIHIGKQTFARSSAARYYSVKKCRFQIYLKNESLASLFKLRWN